MDARIRRNSKRIARNTLLLYFRMLFLMAVSLYTSRVVLEALGVEDFGIYNVVGGMVVMFGTVSGSFSSAVMRFMSYELDKGGDRESLARVFAPNRGRDFVYRGKTGFRGIREGGLITTGGEGQAAACGTPELAGRPGGSGAGVHATDMKGS